MNLASSDPSNSYVPKGFEVHLRALITLCNHLYTPLVWLSECWVLRTARESSVP
jgi:hypothetical protein